MSYLIDVTGRPITKGTDAIRDTFKGAASADLYYSCFIYNRSTDPEDQISIHGKLPEDFALDLQSQWEAPFDQVFGDVAGGAGALLGAFAGVGSAAGQALGQTFGKVTGLTRSVIGSAKTWTGNTEVVLDLPVKIQAYDSTTKEIMQPMKRILKTVAPHLNKAGILVPPGPAMHNFDSSIFGAGNEKAWASAMVASFEEKAFYIQVGTWFKMFPAIIESVNVNFDGLVEHGTGHPLFMEVRFSVKSYLTPTKYDIENWIKER